MYFGIGFLFATLIGVAVTPLVHSRAVRLTIRRLKDSIPQSMAEIQADKDLLRAEFAMSTRRLEMSVEQLKNKDTKQLAELGQKDDAINRLKIEREAQKVEVVALKTEVEALKDQLTAASDEVEAAEGWHHECDVSLVPRQRIGAREGSDFSGGLEVVEPSIEVPSRTADYSLVSNRPPIGNRIFRRSSARFFIAALIGVGTMFAWQSHGNEAKEMIRTWVASLGWLSSVSTTKLPPDVPAEQPGSIPASQVSAQDTTLPQSAPATQGPTPPVTDPPPELVKPLEEAKESDLTGVGHSVEQLPAKQEQTAQDIAPPVEHDGQKMSVSALQIPEKLIPTPETRSTGIADWTLREVIEGVAVLQGPNGVRRVTQGDTLPGLGRVNSIVRWGNRWVVATSRGYCTSVVPNHPVQDGICKPYRAN